MTLTTTTKTVLKPAGIRAGDVLVFWVITDGNDASFNVTFPPGWRRLEPRVYDYTVNVGGDSGGIQVAVRTATSNEPTEYTATITPNINANSGGIYALRGVTVDQLQGVTTRSRTPIAVPRGFALHGLRLRVPSELLWIANADISASTNVTFTPPPGFTLLGDHQGGFNNIALAHARFARAGHTGALCGYTTAASGTIVEQGWVIAFPIIPRRVNSSLLPVRTLRPQWDVANTNWSAI